MNPVVYNFQCKTCFKTRWSSEEPRCCSASMTRTDDAHLMGVPIYNCNACSLIHIDQLREYTLAQVHMLGTKRCPKCRKDMNFNGLTSVEHARSFCSVQKPTAPPKRTVDPFRASVSSLMAGETAHAINFAAPTPSALEQRVAANPMQPYFCRPCSLTCWVHASIKPVCKRCDANLEPDPEVRGIPVLKCQFCNVLFAVLVRHGNGFRHYTVSECEAADFPKHVAHACLCGCTKFEAWTLTSVSEAKTMKRMYTTG